MWDYVRYYVRVWDWGLFLSILLFVGLQNVYQLYRVRLVGAGLPDPESLAIVSQWQFVGLVVEVFQEASVLAIFFFLGSQIRNTDAVQLDRTKSVFAFVFLASLVFAAGVFIFRDGFIAVIGTPTEIQEQTRAYLGVSIFSVPFAVLGAAVVVLFEALGLRRLVFVMAVANVALRFLFDTLFFGEHAFSLRADVTGVGSATLLASMAVFAVGLSLLLRAKDVPPEVLKTLPTFTDMREYLRVGLGSGADSVIRNLFYFLMIIRMVNTIGTTEIGGYYLAMQVLWSFMLVPVLALGDSAKALVANASDDIERVRTLWRSSMLITACMMIVWVAAAPLFGGFVSVLSDDADTIQWAVAAFGILFVPYVLLSFNTVMDSFLYGLGVTKYLAYQSLITNGTVYTGAFLLYAAGLWSPTFAGVMLLFALGIVIDSFLTLYFVLKALYVDRDPLNASPSRPIGASSRGAASAAGERG